MKAAAAIDHDMDGEQGHAAADMPVHHLQRAGGERGGDDRHHHQIDCAQHLFRRLGQSRRAVEDHAVIIVQSLDQLAQPLLLVDRVEEQVEPAQRIVGADQRQAGNIGLADQPFHRDVAREDRLGPVAGGGAAEQPGRGRLRIEVPEQGPARAQAGRAPGQVDRHAGLPHPALQAVDRDRGHGVPWFLPVMAHEKGRRRYPRRPVFDQVLIVDQATSRMD